MSRNNDTHGAQFNAEIGQYRKDLDDARTVVEAMATALIGDDDNAYKSVALGMTYRELTLATARPWRSSGTWSTPRPAQPGDSHPSLCGGPG